MKELKEQLKSIKKELGKPRFSQYIYEDISLMSKTFMILGALFGVCVSLLMWYNFYLNQDDYWYLSLALFLSLSFVNAYDVWIAILYKKYVFIGDRGIALLEVKTKTIPFDAIDKIIIDKKHHYAVGQGGEMVEHLCIVVNKKTVLDINPKKVAEYTQLKKVLELLYTKHQIRTNKEVNITTNTEKLFFKYALLFIPLFLIIVNIFYHILAIDFYSKVMDLLSLGSMLFLAIVALRLVFKIPSLR